MLFISCFKVWACKHKKIETNKKCRLHKSSKKSKTSENYSNAMENQNFKGKHKENQNFKRKK